MNLRQYVKTHPGSGAWLSVQLGISQSYLSQMASGLRPVPVEMCAQLEALTGHCVRRWDMRPESWHRIWPELINAPGAPAIPQREAA